MQNVEVDYLDGEIEVMEDEPSTIAECVSILGTENAVVDEVTSNLRYRNKYPRVYKKASKELESLVPKEVKDTKTLKDGTKVDVKESDMNHLRKCYKADAEKTKSVVSAFAISEPLWVKGERSGGGGRIAQAALDAANEWFAQGSDVVEAKILFIEATVPAYKIGRDADGSPTPESVARGVQALNSYLKKQAQKATKDALAAA